MSQHLFNDTDITAIANAIRTKKGTQNTMTITQMPAEIESIPSGGSTDPVAVRFLDFDGTVVQELNDNGLNGLIALPEAPDHSQDNIPLTFDEWNWTLNEIKTFRTANPTWTVNVGANYHTTDGKLHVLINIDVSSRTISFKKNSTSGTVDWGDGTVETMVATNTHTYTAGQYEIVIDFTNSGNSVTFNDSDVDYITDVRQCQSNDFTGYYALSNLKTINYSSSTVNLDWQGMYSLEWMSIPRNARIDYHLLYCYKLKYQPRLYSTSETKYGITESHDIEEIYMPDYISQIDASITGFATLTSTKIIHLSNTITVIPTNCFRDCSSLEEIDIPSGVTKISQGAFTKCYNLKKITIPNTVTQFESTAFTDCYSLSEISLPTGLTSIPSSCFSGCKSLRRLTIPSSVTNIYQKAFNATMKLTLEMKSTTPPTLSDSTAVSGASRILVPYSSDHSVLNAYQTAQYWSTSASKIFESPAPTV